MINFPKGKSPVTAFMIKKEENMKNFIATIFIAALLFLLTGCSPTEKR